MPVTVNKVIWADLKNEFQRPLKVFSSHCKQKVARNPAPSVCAVNLHSIGNL